MYYPLVTIGLAPILLAQGRRVRRDTIRLPEAEGQRHGERGDGERLRVLIVGDSAAAGVGATHQDHALSGRLTMALSARFNVSWRLLATTGHTTAEVIKQLESAEPAPVDIVVTSVGVNDATAGTSTSQWMQRQQQLLDILHQRFEARHIMMTALPPMQVFPALPQPLRWYMGLRAARLNKALSRLLLNVPHAELVTPRFPLELAYMAEDGFHPGPLAYALWAEQMAEAICRRLDAGAAETRC